MTQISDALKKPEFVKLLNEYMDEISDPKNKEVFYIQIIKDLLINEILNKN